MKQHYFLLLLLSTLSTTSCTRVANRIAYGKDGAPSKVISTPKTPSQAVSEVIQAKQTVDQYSKEVKAQGRQAKEERYAAIQREETNTESLHELQTSVKILFGHIETLRAINNQIDRENKQLLLQLTNADQELTALKTRNAQLTSSIGLLAERINALELSPAITAAFQASTAQEAANLTEMPVVSNIPTVKVKKSSPAKRSGTSYRSYTPKSSQYYIRGPRGGCYYINSNGNKTYVDRSLCD